MWQLRWITGGRSQGPLSVELPGTTLGAGARRPEPSTATCPGSTRRADARTLRCGDLARPVIRKRTRVTTCLCRRRCHRHVHFCTRIITWRGVWAGRATFLHGVDRTGDGGDAQRVLWGCQARLPRTGWRRGGRVRICCHLLGVRVFLRSTRKWRSCVSEYVNQTQLAPVSTAKHASGGRLTIFSSETAWSISARQLPRCDRSVSGLHTAPAASISLLASTRPCCSSSVSNAFSSASNACSSVSVPVAAVAGSSSNGRPTSRGDGDGVASSKSLGGGDNTSCGFSVSRVSPGRASPALRSGVSVRCLRGGVVLRRSDRVDSPVRENTVSLGRLGDSTMQTRAPHLHEFQDNPVCSVRRLL